MVNQFNKQPKPADLILLVYLSWLIDTDDGRPMKKEKRVTYIDDLKLGYKNGADLLNLINKQIKTASNKQIKPEINLIKIVGLIHEYLAQWENVQLGDKVEYKPQIIVMKNLFENKKPEPEQLELNFNQSSSSIPAAR